MSNTINTDDKIKGKDFLEAGFLEKEFENVHFISCNFHQANASNIDFIDCIFEDCNLSLMVVNNTGFKNINFVNSKLTGINFSTCNNFLFQVSFTGCNLKLTNFEKTKLTETLFENCNLTESYFAETNLEKAIFENCNLNLSIFSYTNLKSSDFSTSYNYTINPDENSIKKAKFSLIGLPGLLSNFGIEIV